MKIKFTYRFESAHRFLKSNSKCSTPHGHTWYATLELESLLAGLNNKNMVEDFAVLKQDWRIFVDEVLDHSFFHNFEDGLATFLKKENDLLRLLPFPGDPTTELVALLCFQKMEVLVKSKNLDKIVRVSSVLIQETPTNSIELNAEAKTKLIEPFKKMKSWWNSSDVLARHLEL